MITLKNRVSKKNRNIFKLQTMCSSYEVHCKICQITLFFHETIRKERIIFSKDNDIFSALCEMPSFPQKVLPLESCFLDEVEH